jgi:two-component system NtrC family sensor kinase
VFQEGLPAATRDGVWQGETALLSRSGRVIPVEQIILAHMGADGHVAFLSTIARDLSERQRAEAELARQQGLMTQNEKLAAMSTLLAGVAHELNNPLAVVVGRSALLQMKALDPDVVRQVAQIEEAATRCTRIVKNFLAVARQQPPERAACLLDLVVRDALEILSYSLRVDGVDLRLELAGDRHLLQADAHQLQQVVINLVSNAHHAVRGVATRGITLRTQYDDAHGVARLIVEDTGPGITPEVERRLFEPFFTTKPLGQGTGLGLSLCRGIVEDHGGRIRVEGRPGLGARFLIELPVPRSDEPPPAPPCRILVVDDEPSVAHTVAGLLASDGHEADAVTSVASALERLAAQAYAVVFSDVRMPELDGLAFYRLLAHQYPALCARLIFLTGDTLDPTLGTQLRETGRPSIAKPLTRGHLRRAIAQVLAAAS